MKTNSRFIRSFWVFGIAVLTCLPLVEFALMLSDKESAKTDDKNAAAKNCWQCSGGGLGPGRSARLAVAED